MTLFLPFFSFLFAKEHLGEADRGIVMFRNLLRAQIQAVQAGNDPVGVNRDQATDEMIRLIPEEAYNAFSFAAARQRQA